MSKIQKNVLGGDLELCSSNPLTGWYRDVVTQMKMIMDYIQFVQR